MNKDRSQRRLTRGGQASEKDEKVEIIRTVAAQPCVNCPATGMVTFQCWNCELFIGGHKNGDVKCAYPFDNPLSLHLFRLECDATRWSVKYHFRKNDVTFGHPALYEFSRIYECEIGRVWNTWVKDKTKLDL